MQEATAAVEKTLKRVATFQRNTKKSVSKLKSSAEVQVRVELLEEYWRKFSDAWEEWEDALNDTQDQPKFTDDTYEQTESDYLEAKGELRTLLAQFEPAPDERAQRVVVQQAETRVKAIEPPTFSGEFDDWVGFRDLFRSIVNDNKSLNDVHRLQYLRSACKGKAAEHIDSIEVTEGNFKVAWDMLIATYENERLIVSRMIEKIMDLPAMTRECPDELQRLLGGTNKMLRTLEVLNRPTKHWDDWLIVHTTRKLDYETRLNWERSIGSTTLMPTYDELNQFLSGTLRSFEAMKTVGQTAINSRRSVRTHVIMTGEGEKGCLLCRGPHGLFKCSQFLAKTVSERREFVDGNHICFNCIGSTKHVSRHCPNRYHCLECQRHHHTLLHDPTERPQEGNTAPHANPFIRASVSSSVCSRYEPTADGEVKLLPTAWVAVTARNGKTVQLRALIDQASEGSFVTANAVRRLALATTPTKVIVIGTASPGQSTGWVSLNVAPVLKSGETLKVNALVLPKITTALPSQQISRPTWPVLQTLSLADQQFDEPGEIDLLLGSDVFFDVLRFGVHRGTRCRLVAQQTIFGWMVSGQAAATSSAVTTVSANSIQLDGLLRRFWEQEEVQQRPVLSVDDAACETLYNATTKRAADGRYVVELPFRQGGRELGESRANAIRRLMQMEKRGDKYPEMYDGYRKFLNTYLQLGHMEEIPHEDIEIQPHCYLPHHAVFKPDSTTTKIRVVFDATAATSNGKGLNHLLLTGPRLQETLTAILMRWRMHKIAFSADIEKMYRQMWVRPEHCEYQRIVWREKRSEPIRHYRLKTVTYGTASAPYVAVKTIQRLADDEEATYPRAAQIVRNDFYVDDCMSGADTVEEVCQLKDELLGIMAAGGLRLLKWSSNSKELLQTLPEEMIECHSPLRIDEDDSIKALGVHWHPAADVFTYKVNLPASADAITKRQMLSQIAMLFDSLGLLAPMIITAKIKMQQLWLTGLGWDEQLNEEMLAWWRAYREELSMIEDVRVPRWIGTGKMAGRMQLHGFSDASQLAFAACVYARVVHDDGSIVVSLLVAKTKVAPIKQQSIPRLELNGAVLLVRLLKECRQGMRCDDSDTFAWTDSTVVLAWLRRHANVWKTFVANRVSEVQTSMSGVQWQHVPGVDNPADVASRGAMPSVMRDHKLWWKGPSWLSGGPEKWPQQRQLEVDATLLEEKEIVRCNAIAVKKMNELIYRFSTWKRLLRVTAYCYRVYPSNRTAEHTLQADEIEAARRVWLRLAQQHDFGDVRALLKDVAMMRKCGLHKLKPFVDEAGLLRVGGRLVNAIMPYEEQHPVILSGCNDLVRLLITDAHERVFHRGPQSTINQLRQRYWILQERRQVRACVHKCVLCAKARPRAQQQLMGDLPAARVRATRPFLHTGIDYAGPIWARTAKGRGHKAFKAWIAVFICFSTKAVHLEVVSDVSSAAFIAAFHRFTSRRGLCSDVYCDNGTNFVGADREMRKQLADCMQNESWRAILGDSGTRFHFAPPGSPHFNGLAESTVRMAKTAMRKVIGDHKLTFEELTTFLAQVEAALNSRPLCVASADGNDENVLTPGHFLIGHPLTSVPEPNKIDGATSTNRWRLVQQLVQHFWKRWSQEYLHQLQQREKWHQQSENIKIGDIVMLHDEQLHSTRWKIGRIVETHPGADGRVRVASVKTATGTVKRAVAKITLLPVENTQ